MREYQRSRHSSSLHSIRVRIFLFIYFVDLYFHGWAEGPSFLQKLPTGTTQTIRVRFIYVGKPVGSRTDFLGERKAQFRTVNFVPKTCLPFAQISSFDRKTAAKAWNCYQRWVEEMELAFCWELFVRKARDYHFWCSVAPLKFSTGSTRKFVFIYIPTGIPGTCWYKTNVDGKRPSRCVYFPTGLNRLFVKL